MSVRDKVRRLLGLAVLLGCLFGPISIAFGQLTGEVVAVDSPGRSALQTGVRLERSGQWLDAIEHYEKSLKSWSGNSELKYGLRRSKIHFGISRRYSDSSFERSLVTKSRHDALALFDEVELH
jgi:carboxyl-terminal processing protease